MDDAQALRTKTRKTPAGPSKPMLHLRYGGRLKLTPSPQWIRLVKEVHKAFDGSDVPFFEYVEHFAKRTNRGFVCSRVYKQLANTRGDYVTTGTGQCAGCHELGIPEGAWDFGPNPPKDLARRAMSGFLALSCEPHHLVESRDQQGRLRVYERDSRWGKKGDPIMERVLCAGRGCEPCAERADETFGKLMHWSVGSGHFSAISSFADDLERECRDCGGELAPQAYHCPQCGERLIDMRSTTLTDEQLADATSLPCKCGSCHRTILMRAVFLCSGCKDPVPTSLFDVEVYVKKITPPGGGFPVLQFVKHRVCEISDELQALLPVDKEGRPRKVLHRVFAADPLPDQCRVLNIENPFVSASEHTQAYETAPAPVEDDLPAY